MSKSRIFGVTGKDLPTKKSSVVQASDFAIGGMIGLTERTYDQAWECRNMNEFQNIFGGDFSSSAYAYEEAQLFFHNAPGGSSLWFKSHVGNTGSAINAVAATVTLNNIDSAPSAAVKLSAGHLGVLEYGTHGNRIGYTITAGARYSTSIGATGAASDLSVTLTSVIGVKVGDIIKVLATGSAPATVYKKITQIDESTGKAYFSGVFHASSNAVAADVVTVLGMQIKTYEKSLSGIVKEVDQNLGKIYVTMAPEVTDYYINNVFANSNYLKVEDQLATIAGTAEKIFPADVSTVTYLTTGVYGTAPTTLAHWGYRNYTAFDTLPIRFLCNAETTLSTVNAAMESYSRARYDHPIVIYNIAANQTKTTLTTIGSSYQRSDDVLGTGWAQWVQISDPFSSSSIAPARNVPNVGACMGAWIRTIATYGIHCVPGLKQIPIIGIIGVYGTQFPDNQDRTDLADSGVNCIEFLTGMGYVMRNARSFSSSTDYRYDNALLMRNYIHVSCVDSLQLSENTPNSWDRIQADRNAIEFFMRRLWERGSTGTVAEGETFGQWIKADGKKSSYDDSVQVQADIVNNPLSKIQLGERNLDVYFTYPTPAESIMIGVGVVLQS